MNTLEKVMDRLIICEPSALPTGCWEWPGRRCTGHYGQISFHGRLTMVHRLIYEHLRGPIPAGMELDHRCRNRICANPDHMDVLTTAAHRALGSQPYQKPERRTYTHRRSCPHGLKRIIDCGDCMRAYHRGYRKAQSPRQLCRKGHPITENGFRSDGTVRRFCSICLTAAARKPKPRRKD